MSEVLFEAFFVSFAHVSDACEINGDDTDRSGHLGRSEETVSSLQELFEVKLEPAAHRSHGSRRVGILILRDDRVPFPILHSLELRSDEVLEVGQSVFCGHLEEELGIRRIPIEVVGDIVGGYREGEDPAFGISCDVNLDHDPVDHVHLLLELSVWLDIWTSFVSSQE